MLSFFLSEENSTKFTCILLSIYDTFKIEFKLVGFFYLDKKGEHFFLIFLNVVLVEPDKSHWFTGMNSSDMLVDI